MPQYDPIGNERLRALVMASESIHSLPEEDIQKMVTQIAALDDNGQEAMIKTLEDEQKQIAAAKRAKGITPEMELAAINENMAKVAAIKRDFEMSVLKENEREETQQSEKAAEDILKGIDK
jgi:hypothetical protein